MAGVIIGFIAFFWADHAYNVVGKDKDRGKDKDG